MVFYDPEKPVKLSLWVHHDLLMNQRIHPIQEDSHHQAETKFYASLKRVLKELFPTVSFCEGDSYLTLISHVRKLKASLRERLHNLSVNSSKPPSKHGNTSCGRKEEKREEKMEERERLGKMASMRKIKFYAEKQEVWEGGKWKEWENLRETKGSENEVEEERQNQGQQ